MYDDTINLLKAKGVVFADGLKTDELNEIESRYQITFPVELRSLYMMGLPISAGFYNWRDTSDENTSLIDRMISDPIKDIAQDVKDGYAWCDEWGEKPDNLETANGIVMKRYSEAPRLIPIYSHRYIPSMCDTAKIPILSVHGSDIIYYGEDLASYLEMEFGLKVHSEIQVERCIYIPFWSDFI